MYFYANDIFIYILYVIFMRLNNVILGVIVCFFVACTNYHTNILNGNNIVVNDFPKTDTLKSEKLALEILGLNVVHVVDTFLVGFKGTGIDHFFEIYSLPNLHYLGKYILAGRGPNELLTLQYHNQFQKKGEEITMWISDAAVNRRILFNLTKSLQEQKTVFDTVIYIPSFNCCFNQNDTLMSLFKYDGTNCKHILYNLERQTIESERFMFKDFPALPDLKSIFGGYLAIDPRGDKCVMAMSDVNQIGIFSNDLKECFSISYGEPIDIWSVLNTPDSLRIWYYSSVYCSSNYIYGLYINREARYWGEHDGCVQIHMFNYVGEPIARLVIPNDIVFFAVDEEHKYIYGVKRNEEVFRYDFRNAL